MNDHTRTCRLCAEEIKSAARVCPKCRQWQRKWSALNPTFVYPLMVLVLAVAILSVPRMFDRLMMNPKPAFESFRDDLYVTSSSMHFGETGTDRTVVVVGTITSRSAVAWKNLEIDCRFLNSKGEMVDAKNQLTSLIVLGNDEIAFRVETRELRPRADYASHRAAVRYAVNARAWP